MIHSQLPNALPILALPHPVILLPGSRVSVHLSRKLAHPLIKLLTDAADETTNDSSVLVAAVPIIVENKSGSADDGKASGNGAGKLCEWGCSARVIRIVRPPTLQASQLHIVTLQGVQRIQLTPPIPTLLSNPLLRPQPVTYPPSPFPLNQQTLDLFRATTVKLLHRLSVDDAETRKTEGGENPKSQRSLATLILGAVGGDGADPWGKLSKLVKEVDDERLPWISDQVMSLVGNEFNEKIEYLTLADCEARLRFAINVFTKQLSIAEVTSSVSKSIEENLSKQQKEFFLRQQKAAIDRELANLRNSGTPSGPKSELDGEQDEQSELADLKGKIELLVPGSEERTMAVREFKRLKRIQSSSVEHGVIRTYLEWLTSLPWPQVSLEASESRALSLSDMTDRELLTRARNQLDSDHYGMEKVKRRLIEYLAVVRLKAIEAKKLESAPSSSTGLSASTKDSSGSASGQSTPESGTVPSAISGVKKASTNRGPILLLYGPPGVGKTSIAQSLAKALKRPFQRISLGGVRDEAEIRGHRRTYVASGPGNIVQALRKAGRPDPVILLDEIDKVGHSSNHGDPAAALLEVLDPEQNCTFSDHYINVPIDLSQVLFIATANTLDTISAPLLDRCEALRLTGYTQSEKLKIAKRYLIPKQLRANGLQVEAASAPSRCEITDGAVKKVIGSYTREAGVRGLERELGSVVRFKAVEWSEADHATGVVTDSAKDATEIVSSVVSAASPTYSSVVAEEDLEMILGPVRFEGEDRDPVAKRGIVYGLVVMGEGEGGILPVETAILPGTGQLKLSGSLGDVIRESAELALSWVKAHAYALGITPTTGTDPLKHPSLIDIHLHLPAGAQKKDGPSAGVAMAVAFVSLLTGLTVPSTTAMTGEITLRGNVTPVGGVKEKVLGAHRAGVRNVILPEKNRRDVDLKDIGEEVMSNMNFVFVRTIEEALREVFGEHSVLSGRGGVLVESRL
ncbi:hypothetical protein FRB93_000872 [Tulasnella sp. JGI-2019a]|nr:hypothetical protein FRB93_000872 [Tulasnella sp. JGI-2019a]